MDERDSEAARDGAWHDAMYNNRARVPEAGAILAGWAERSAAARRRLACELDLAYGSGAGETLDVFPPLQDTAGQPAPVLLFIHGGYWRALDKADHSFVAEPFVERGACVVIPNYALCPAVDIPHITRQMRQALAWTAANAARWGADPSRIVVAGHSAGGQLAAMMLAGPGGVASSALAISALHDLEPMRRTPFLQVDLRLTAEAVEAASPARQPAPAKGRLYSVVGGDESEEYLRQNQLIRERWGSERVPVCEAVPGCNHFTVLEALATPGARPQELALELLGLRRS